MLRFLKLTIENLRLKDDILFMSGFEDLREQQHKAEKACRGPLREITAREFFNIQTCNKVSNS